MKNTPIEKITLKCTVTSELVTYRGWDYISKRIQKAGGSLELLEKTFVSRKGLRLSKGTVAVKMNSSTTTKKPRKTKQEMVDSFVGPKTKKLNSSKSSGYQARLVDGKYILSKDGEEYTQFTANPNNV